MEGLLQTARISNRSVAEAQQAQVADSALTNGGSEEARPHGVLDTLPPEELVSASRTLHSATAPNLEPWAGRTPEEPASSGPAMGGTVAEPSTAQGGRAICAAADVDGDLAQHQQGSQRMSGIQCGQPPGDANYGLLSRELIQHGMGQAGLRHAHHGSSSQVWAAADYLERP